MFHTLVCPRDHKSLTQIGNTLTCPDGHQYPIHGGIPIFVLPDVDQTTHGSLRALDPEQIAKELEWDDGSMPSPDEFHPLIRQLLGGTCGNMYDAVKHQLPRYPIPRLRFAPNAPGESLLDIGCNWGRWSVAAAQAGYQVTGIDPSLGALVVARRVFRQLGLNGTFICADARYLPFKNDNFDMAFSYSVLQHFSKSDVRLALAEIARVTKGSSLIQMANKFGLRSIYHQARKLGSTPDIFAVRYWSPRELISVFSEIVGPSQISIDGFFGLGMQASDLKHFRLSHQWVVRASEALRKHESLSFFADSLYVRSQVK
jgi:SAM-dependent methyltransferase/uncharacterized protein YbaR (Trm112 family)